MWDRGYYYQHKRIDGKPRRVYVGAGPVAALASQMDAQEQAQRAAQDAQRRLERARDRAATKEIDGQYDRIRASVAALLIANGFYQHKREWRRMDLKAFAKRIREAEERDALRAAGKLTASAGADYHPATAAELKHKDLSAARALSGLMVADQMVSSYCGKNQPEAQAVIRQELCALCEDLGMDDAPAIERELIAHVAECWVWLKLAQLTLNRISSAEHTFREGQYREQRVSEAQRRYLRAMNLLAKLRHLGPAVQVNVANQQVVMNGPNG